MKSRAAALVLVLAGCAAPAVTPPVSLPVAQPAPVVAAAGPSALPTGVGLRRIGYRNCNGFDMQLFAPMRPGAREDALLLRVVAYRGVGPARVTLSGGPVRLQRASDAGWQTVALPPQRGAGAQPLLSGGATAVPLRQLLGQWPLAPGRYRLWLAPLSAGPGCSMAPVWIFEQGG